MDRPTQLIPPFASSASADVAGAPSPLRCPPTKRRLGYAVALILAVPKQLRRPGCPSRDSTLRACAVSGPDRLLDFGRGESVSRETPSPKRHATNMWSCWPRICSAGRLRWHALLHWSSAGRGPPERSMFDLPAGFPQFLVYGLRSRRANAGSWWLSLASTLHAIWAMLPGGESARRHLQLASGAWDADGR